MTVAILPAVMSSLGLMMRFCCLLIGWSSLLSPMIAANAQDIPKLSTARSGEPLEVKGKPKAESFTDQSPRYFIWHDDDGWHLRSASNAGLVKFEGTITSSTGAFGKLRPVGLDTKPKNKNPDSWRVDPARQKLEFQLFTSGSFDGFDFTLPKNDAGTLTFDLRIGGKERPARVFVGKEMQTPTDLPLIVPAGEAQ